MRKISNDSVRNFMNGKVCNINNTSVSKRYNGDVTMSLFGNEIAQLKSGNMLFVCTAGFNTRTTLERLNSLPNVNVTYRKGMLMLNGEIWDGSWKMVV